MLEVSVGIITILVDRVFIKIYRYPSLSILIALCWNSKNFRWLAYNIIGNDDWYYKNVIESIKKQTKE